MRSREDLRQLFEYDDWANDRLLAMLYQAFGEEADLRHAEDARVREIQAVTTHIVAALAIWRTRWEGHSPTAMLDPEEYSTPLALRMAFGAERARFWGFFATLEDEEALNRVVHFTRTTGEPYQFPLWQMMQHVLTHSAYHRGQVTARLLDLGHESALQFTDLIVYYREQQQ
jgi:uncharacterized damage-inducible protein DinB